MQQQKNNISNSQMYSAPQENITYSQPDISSDISNYSRPESDYVNSETIHNYNNNTLYANGNPTFLRGIRSGLLHILVWIVCTARSGVLLLVLG
jgi:hypothetical protein